MYKFGLMNAVPIRSKQKSNPIFKGQSRRHPHIIPIRRNTQAKNLNGQSAQEAKYNLFGIGKISPNNRKEPEPNLQSSDTSFDISSFSPKISSTQINGIENMPSSTDTADDGFFNISTEFMSENNSRTSNEKKKISSNSTNTNNGLNLSFNKTSSNKKFDRHLMNKTDVRNQFGTSKRNNDNFFTDFDASDTNDLNRTFNLNFDPEYESAHTFNNTFENKNSYNFNDSVVADSNCNKDSNIYDFLDDNKNDYYVNNVRRPDKKLTCSHGPGYSNSEILNWLDPKETGDAKPKYSQDFQNNISTFEKSEYSSDLDYQSDATFDWETPKFPKNHRKVRFTDHDIAFDNHKSSSKKIPIFNGRSIDNTTKDDFFSDLNCSKVNDSDFLQYPVYLDSKETEVKKKKYSQDFQRNISARDKLKHSPDKNNIFLDWEIPGFSERDRKSRSSTRKLHNFVDDVVSNGHTSSSKEFPIFDGRNMKKKSSCFNTTNNDNFFFNGTNFCNDFHSSEMTDQDLIKYPDNSFESKGSNIYNTRNAPTYINIFL